MLIEIDVMTVVLYGFIIGIDIMSMPTFNLMYYNIHFIY